jgi:hypothetical protein
MIRSVAISIAVVLTQAACSKPPEPICQALDTTIDNNVRQVALTLAEGDVFDKGAMQQAARYIAANNHLQVIQISLSLQSEHKCTIRKSVINPLQYRSEALKCLTATIGEKKDDAATLCDIKNWKGDSK